MSFECFFIPPDRLVQVAEWRSIGQLLIKMNSTRHTISMVPKRMPPILYTLPQTSYRPEPRNVRRQQYGHEFFCASWLVAVPENHFLTVPGPQALSGQEALDARRKIDAVWVEVRFMQDAAEVELTNIANFASDPTLWPLGGASLRPFSEISYMNSLSVFVRAPKTLSLSLVDIRGG